MKKWSSDTVFWWLAVLSVFLVVMDIFANWGDWTEVFWFCPLITLLLAYALFRRSALFLSVCLVLSVPAQSLWALDFIFEFFGRGMGRTAMLEPCGPLIYWGSAVIHTFVIPVSFWGVARLGFERRSLVWAFVCGAILMVGTFLLTPSFKNVNCVFFPCDADDPGGGYLRYFLTRVLLVWALVVPLSYLFFRFVFRNNLSGFRNQGE